MKQVALIVAVLMLGAFTPPSGRPPIGPLERYEPKAYDLQFMVTLSTLQQIDGSARQNYNLEKAPIVMPVIFMGTFSKVASDTVTGKIWLDAREDDPHTELKSGYPYGTYLATLTIGRYQGQSLRWQVSYRMQSWSSRLNDEKAALVPWPKEWPKEAQDGLQPQKYIESDDPIFKQAVDKVSEGKLRLVPPFLAAKDLIRYCINQIQTTGDGIDRGEFKMIRGLLMTGAREAATKKIGTPHDLVCVCVATLRAAGIPARPVIGVMEDANQRGTFVSWAEFYLPDVGWIPFDPFVMRGKGIRTMDVRKPWPELGDMKNLNERIPLAYHFIPPATVQTPRNPAVWGWDPRPGMDVGSDQMISISIVSRGKGTEDPQ